MRISAIVLPLCLLASGCQSASDGSDPSDEKTQADDSDSATNDDPALPDGPIPVEPDGGIGDGAGPIPGSDEAKQSGDETLEKSFPVAIRGQWRLTDSDTVTAEQCDNYKPDNMGLVLNIRADNFSYFEEGGRLLDVKERSDAMIRAVFDTSYADDKTTDDLEFSVDWIDKTLTVKNHDKGQESVRIYRRCPKA